MRRVLGLLTFAFALTAVAFSTPGCSGQDPSQPAVGSISAEKGEMQLPKKGAKK
jgi:hypothetical protein